MTSKPIPTPARTIDPKVQMADPKTENVARSSFAEQQYMEMISRMKATSEIVRKSRMAPSSLRIVDTIVAAHPAGMSIEVAAKRAGLSKRSSAFRRYIKEAAGDPRIHLRADGRYVATVE